jgi:hypothetical protein
MNECKRLLSDDVGAVTIDWVMLTAGVLLLGIAAVYSIFNDGVMPLGDTTNSTLSSMDIEVPVSTLN